MKNRRGNEYAQDYTPSEASEVSRRGDFTLEDMAQMLTAQLLVKNVDRALLQEYQEELIYRIKCEPSIRLNEGKRENIPKDEQNSYADFTHLVEQCVAVL